MNDETNEPWETMNECFMPLICFFSGLAIGGCSVLIYLKGLT